MTPEKLKNDEAREHLTVWDEAIRCIKETGSVKIEIGNGDIRQVTSEEELKKLSNL